VRVLLDTNVWQYLVERDAINELRVATRARGWQVVVAPSVVYELLRHRDPVSRGGLVEAVTRGAWLRLMPEAYSECQDIVNTIRRHRPDWLLATPDLAAYHRQRADWVGRGGFWGRARRDPAWKSAILETLEADVFDRARADAERRRSEFAHIPFDKLTLTGWTVRGPRGATTEPWRIETADVWWTALSGRAQRAYLDWCEPFLDLRKVCQSRGDWDKLWFEAAEMTEVPREWLRWATRWLQGTRRVTAGTPGDNQLAAYLTEADVLVTGDKAFVDIVDRVRTDAPFMVARPIRVRPVPTIVEEITTKVEAVGVESP
jgi:predicted nucleic acid-binding protein